MSDTWVPKVGDRVMVGEHGPYEVIALSDSEYVQIEIPTDMPRKLRSVLPDWLTPAPEPEPEEPTAPGALVRDGRGNLLALDKDGDWLAIDGPPITGDWFVWVDLPRPITVVLADPAEVEQLRAERDAYRKAKQENDERFQVEAARQRERADKLQNELDCIYRRLSAGPAFRTYEAEVRWREWVAASISRRGKS